jgi:hypothetical protein
MMSLGPFLHSLLYGAVSIACTYCSCPVLIIPLIMCCCCHFGHVVVILHLCLCPCHHLVVVVLLIEFLIVGLCHCLSLPCQLHVPPHKQVLIAVVWVCMCCLGAISW